MYKVYISDTFMTEEAQRVCSALPKDMYTCCGDKALKNLFPDHAEEDLYSCDIFLCRASYMDPDNIASGSVDTILSRVTSDNIPAVIIREQKKHDFCGMMSLQQIESYNIARIFEAEEDKALKGLPIFLEETILMYKERKGGAMVLDKSQQPDVPYQGKENYLFVSYEKEKDKLRAYPLIRNLQDHGYRVWYDDKEDGAYDPEEIAERIELSSCMIALISPNYIESQSCKDEINLARSLNKERILVYLEKTRMSTGMAMRLLRLQAIHKYSYKTRKEFYDKLYSAKGLDAAKD